jgi:CDP-paratose 2-epimerase
VIIFDNLGRPGVEENLHWLRRTYGDLVTERVADVRDCSAVRGAVAEAGEVYHLAAQVAVTTSVARPEEDFEINARGTLNVLEALRALPDRPPLIFTSTNKVYGKLDGQKFAEGEKSYTPFDDGIAALGIAEDQPLDFYSPYGCSKGTADQYVRDYARIYGLPAVVFRMSCIYGPHQRGTEDQGWVAHFLLRALRGETITLYGNGKQVRDILFVEDLVEAFLLARENIDLLRGQVFNIGGGPARTVSLLELLGLMERLHGIPTPLAFGPWRPGDQPWYVSDTHHFRRLTGWEAKTGVAEGVGRLYDWLRENARREPARHQEAAVL